MLETTNLQDGIILSTLSINFQGFAFSFLKRPCTNGDSVFMIFLLISQCETTLLNNPQHPQPTHKPLTKLKLTRQPNPTV